MFEIDFIVVVRDQLSYTKKCIKSILQTVRKPFQLIIVDNGSGESTTQYLNTITLRKDCCVRVIRNEKNKGYGEALNQGLKFSDAPYVYFCNNDIEFFPEAVDEMIEIANKNSRFGLVNPNSNEFGAKRYDEIALGQVKGKWVERCHTSGFCVLVKREVIQQIGGIDPLFFPAYYEDMDFAERAKSKGFLCVVARGAYVYHDGTRTFLPVEKQSLWNLNREKFIERWGGTRWFAYMGSIELNRSRMHQGQVVQALLEIARREIAVIYIYVPHSVAPIFKNIHHSFRIQPVAQFFAPFLLALRCLTAQNTKPISKILVSDRKILKFWKQWSPSRNIQLLELVDQAIASQ